MTVPGPEPASLRPRASVAGPFRPMARAISHTQYIYHPENCKNYFHFFNPWQPKQEGSNPADHVIWFTAIKPRASVLDCAQPSAAFPTPSEYPNGVMAVSPAVARWPVRLGPSYPGLPSPIILLSYFSHPPEGG
jgi:hypothetical protein